MQRNNPTQEKLHKRQSQRLVKRFKNTRFSVNEKRTHKDEILR